MHGTGLHCRALEVGACMQEVLARDLRDGQYFVTGDLTPEVFGDACRFKDPTNDITGLSRYITVGGPPNVAPQCAKRLREQLDCGPLEALA